jgi:hypothetical protein
MVKLNLERRDALWIFAYTGLIFVYAMSAKLGFFIKQHLAFGVMSLLCLATFIVLLKFK